MSVVVTVADTDSSDELLAPVKGAFRDLLPISRSRGAPRWVQRLDAFIGRSDGSRVEVLAHGDVKSNYVLSDLAREYLKT